MLYGSGICKNDMPCWTERSGEGYVCLAPLGVMINVVKGRLGMRYRRPWRGARQDCHELRDLEAYDMLIGLQERSWEGEEERDGGE